MIQRIVILIKILFKMSDSLYILSDRIEVTQLDTQSFQSHHVIMPQFCFCIAVCDTLTQNMNCERFFHHLNSFKSDRNFQIAFFKNSLTNEKFSFLLISCMRNRHSTVIESYIRRNDVIRCELDCFQLSLKSNLNCTF